MLDLLREDYRAAFACPECREPLANCGDRVSCGGCGRIYRACGGYLDFAPSIQVKPGLGAFYLEDPLHVTRYERHTREAFLNVMGQNWDTVLTDLDEDEYLRAHLEPAEGPVLDLGCGAGRWTRTVTEQVGSGRVVGLDLSTAMLDLIRKALPDVCAVRGTALRLPFGDAALGAVNCSNALQLLPEPRAVVREVSRCLRPGGVFTGFTFRQAERPASRYFQQQHEAAFNVRAFSTSEIVTWLSDCGMELADLQEPAGMLLFTARRNPLLT